MLAMLLGAIACWLGIVLAYFSYNWPPQGRGWPVSFFISVIILIFYLLARLGSFGKVVNRNERFYQ